MEELLLPAEIGELIGGYRLDAVIGRGSMGCVFSATHARLGRRAAVKVLESRFVEDQQFVARFFQEARVVNDARHPNIVDIFDFIETSDPKRVAYVMELVEGASLRTILAQRPLSAAEAAEIGLQLASALEAVHRLSVIHRDLKPENILLTRTEDRPLVKILDFGIAKVVTETAEHLTQTGVILGTPSYMAPEQIAGSEVSGATDIYALGEILFEMLTGHRAYDGERLSVLRAKLMGVLPPLDLPHGTPPALKRLIVSCLALDPKSRPDLAQLSQSLRSYEQEAAVPALRVMAEIEDQPTGPIAFGTASIDTGSGDAAVALSDASMAALAPYRRRRWALVLVAALVGLIGARQLLAPASAPESIAESATDAGPALVAEREPKKPHHEEPRPARPIAATAIAPIADLDAATAVALPIEPSPDPAPPERPAQEMGPPTPTPGPPMPALPPGKPEVQGHPEAQAVLPAIDDPPFPKSLEPQAEPIGDADPRALELEQQGMTAVARQNWTEAERLFEECLRAAEYPPCHRQLGIVFAGRDDRRSAEHFRRYLELRPQAKDRAVVERLIVKLERAAKSESSAH